MSYKLNFNSEVDLENNLTSGSTLEFKSTTPYNAASESTEVILCSPLRGGEYLLFVQFQTSLDRLMLNTRWGADHWGDEIHINELSSRFPSDKPATFSIRYTASGLFEVSLDGHYVGDIAKRWHDAEVEKIKYAGQELSAFSKVLTVNVDPHSE